MNQCAKWIVLLIICLGLLGCSRKSDESAGNGDSQSKAGGDTAKQVDKSGPAVITMTPADKKAKVGETVTITSVMSHVPENQSRWSVSVGWDSSDGQHDAQALKNESGKYLNKCDFVWKEPGEYEVTIKYYGSGNRVFAEQSTTVAVQ